MGIVIGGDAKAKTICGMIEDRRSEHLFSVYDHWTGCYDTGVINNGVLRCFRDGSLNDSYLGICKRSEILDDCIKIVDSFLDRMSIKVGAWQVVWSNIPDKNQILRHELESLTDNLDGWYYGWRLVRDRALGGFDARLYINKKYQNDLNRDREISVFDPITVPYDGKTCFNGHRRSDVIECLQCIDDMIRRRLGGIECKNRLWLCESRHHPDFLRVPEITYMHAGKWLCDTCADFYTLPEYRPPQEKPIMSANKRERRKLNRRLRLHILERDGFSCKYCGRTPEDGIKLHIDHIHPVANGGKTVEDNLQALCDDCNLGKGARIIASS